MMSALGDKVGSKADNSTDRLRKCDRNKGLIMTKLCGCHMCMAPTLLELLRGIHLAADAVATARQGADTVTRKEGLALGRPFAPVILV